MSAPLKSIPTTPLVPLVHPLHARVIEQRAGEERPGALRERGVGAGECRAVEARTAQVGVTEVGVPKVRAAHVGAIEIRVGEQELARKSAPADYLADGGAGLAM